MSSSSSGSGSSSSSLQDKLLLLLVLQGESSRSDTTPPPDTSSYLRMTAEGLELIIHSRVPITRVILRPREGRYTLDESRQKDFLVAKVAGHGTSGDVYFTDDENLVLKLDKRNVNDKEVLELIEAERKNLAQIEELFGVYVAKDKKAEITLMRGYSGTRLKNTEIFKKLCEPASDRDYKLDKIQLLVERVKILTAQNVRHYLMKYHLLHTDIKDRNVLFTLDDEGFPESAQLIDWGEARSADPTNMSEADIDTLIQKQVDSGWDVIYDTAKTRHDAAEAEDKARQERLKKNKPKKTPKSKKPDPWGTPDKKKPGTGGKEESK